MYCWYNDNNVKNPIFRNHFGSCQIAIQIPVIDQQDISLYSLIEVFATKVNAENAEKILLFLESRMEDIIRACFSTTSHKMGEKEGQSNHPSFILKQSLKILDSLSYLMPAFQFRPIRKVRPSIVEVEMNHGKAISDNSINFLCEKPDSLVPASSMNKNNIVTIFNKHYSFDKIKTEILINETDVYENQVIHGFIQDIISTLNFIKHTLENLLSSLDTLSTFSNIPVGYQAFDPMRRAFGKRYYGKLLLECNCIINQYYNCKLYFEKYIPTSCLFAKKPQMTMGFRSNPHYRQLFSLIVQWWQYGKPTPVGDQFLLSLRTLDKLFEFYCLFQLVDILNGMGYRLINSSYDDKVNHFEIANPANIFDFLNNNGFQIRLFYDYEINQRTIHSDIYNAA